MTAKQLGVIGGILVALAGVADAQVVGPEVFAALQTRTSVRVFVQLTEPAVPKSARAERAGAIREIQERALNAAGRANLALAHRYRHVPAFAATVDAHTLQRLARRPEVRRIDLDLGGGGGLAVSVPQVGADQLHDLYGLSGAGINVAVIDSGYDTDHPDLLGSLIAEQCFCSHSSTPIPSGTDGCCPNGLNQQSGAGSAEDDAFHGTHVSGIITSDGVQSSVGVAPAAGVVAVKVLDADNSFCCMSDIVAALEWIADERPEVRAVNMSLGTQSLEFDGDCDEVFSFNMAIHDVVDTLGQNGTIVFAAAMNAGFTNGVGSPACVSNVVAVGAVNSADQVASFSNSGPKLGLWAPGVNVVAPAIGGGTVALSGTSMSTPHAVGAAALLLESFPALSRDELLDVMITTGVPVTDPRNGLTRPRLDVAAAYAAPKCGDGTTDAGEQCDDANRIEGDGCDTNCTATACGNGIATAPEQCDDGNPSDSDACKVDCTLNLCGDGFQNAGVEQCDDGDLEDGDGCDSNCTPTACGNGVTTAGEECDDGNQVDADACRNGCILNVCGDGALNTGAEQCDDGDLDESDYCRSSCAFNVCGDGVIELGVEDCDDGDLEDGDGCDSNCTETGCGNQVVSAGEDCDEGPANGVEPCCTLVCTSIDGDGDDSCDRDDPCPHVAAASPQPLAIKRVQLAYKRNGVGGGDDAAKISRAEFSSAPDFDPDSISNLHVGLIRQSDGASVSAVTLAAGAPWEQLNPARNKWIYRLSSTPGFNARLREQSDGRFAFDVKVTDTDLSAAGAPLAGAPLRVVLEIESGGAGVCFATNLPTCTARGTSDRCQ